MTTEALEVHDPVGLLFGGVVSTSHESSGRNFSVQTVTTDEPPRRYRLAAAFKGVGETRRVTTLLSVAEGGTREVPVRSLNVQEAALLAGFMISPGVMGSFRFPDADIGLLLRSTQPLSSAGGVEG